MEKGGVSNTLVNWRRHAGDWRLKDNVVKYWSELPAWLVCPPLSLMRFAAFLLHRDATEIIDSFDGCFVWPSVWHLHRKA